MVPMAPSKMAMRFFKMPGSACPRVKGCGSKTLMEDLARKIGRRPVGQANQQNLYFHRQFVVSIGVLE
jgi:hypothetical protein